MEPDFTCGNADSTEALRRLQKARLNTAVTQAERAVLEAAKAWYLDQSPRPLRGDRESYEDFAESVQRLLDAEQKRDALNASTVGEERED